MTDTPLSDAMAEYASTRSPDDYASFVAAFAGSTVGFVAVGPGVPAGPGEIVVQGGVRAGRTDHGGPARLLAFADPEVARRNFGPRFNAGMSGAVMLRMAADDPSCEGILVNSATSEFSLGISKSAARSALAADAAPDLSPPDDRDNA